MEETEQSSPCERTHHRSSPKYSDRVVQGNESLNQTMNPLVLTAADSTDASKEGTETLQDEAKTTQSPVFPVSNSMPWDNAPSPPPAPAARPSTASDESSATKSSLFRQRSKKLAFPNDNAADIVIRDFRPSDSNGVRQICWAQFRSLTVPALVHYLIHNGGDVLAFLCITFVFLHLSQLCICLSLYLLYILIRCRLEFELYIRNDCPDLKDIYRTYMTHPKSHFWVGELPSSVAQNSTESQTTTFMEGTEGFPSDSCSAIATSTINSLSTGLNAATTPKASLEEEEGTGRELVASASVPSVAAAEGLPADTPPTSSSMPNALMTNRTSSFWNFLKRRETKSSKTILGCIGLVPYKGDPSVAHLVRLVVSVDARGNRIGSRLLAQLEHFARHVQYRELRIYTNNLNPSSLRFVRQSGFELVQVFRRGLMRGDLMAWKKSLTGFDNGKETVFSDKTAYTVLD